MSLSIPFFVWLAAEQKKAARVEVNISLAGLPIHGKDSSLPDLSSLI